MDRNDEVGVTCSSVNSNHCNDSWGSNKTVWIYSSSSSQHSTTTINQLMQDRYQESKEAMKKVLAENA